MSFSEHSSYHSTTDITQLFYTLFIPENTTVKATLIILHGMQEHSGRYRELAIKCTESGLAVLTYDHVGHGKSVNNKHDFGFFRKNNPAEKLINDADIMSDLIEKKYPAVPHFILGHSMGSFITRCLLQQKSNKFSGAIIVGTGGSKFGIGLLKAYFFITNCIASKRKTYFNILFNKVNNSHFKKDKDFCEQSWLSLSKQNQQNFLKDPLNGLPFTNNAYYALFSVYKQATNRNWANSISKSFPFLFVSGEDDPIGDFSKGVIKTIDQLREDGFINVAFKIFPKMRHEILLEDNREYVITTIIDWIDHECNY